MTLNDIVKKYDQTLDAIRYCVDREYSEALWTLLYSAIDSLSWLYSDETDLEKRNSKEDYIQWVNTFLIPILEGYDCTAMELYLARCSTIHTYSAVAKKQRDNRIVTYAYSKEQLEQVKRKLPIIEELSDSKFVILLIDDLVKAWYVATIVFIKQIEKDSELLERVIKKADYYYSPLDKSFLDEG